MDGKSGPESHGRDHRIDRAGAGVEGAVCLSQQGPKHLETGSSSEVFLQENCADPSLSCTPVYDYQTASSQTLSPSEDNVVPAILSPSQDLRLAFDPRLPADRQSFRFSLAGIAPEDKVKWFVNGDEIAETKGGDYDWRVKRGYYSVSARVETAEGKKLVLGPVAYSVR
jgi:membrane carboxypeptidase/penicillin-binding protein PbpC